MSDVPIPQVRQEWPAFRRLAPQGAGALPGFAKADAEAAAGEGALPSR